MKVILFHDERKHIFSCDASTLQANEDQSTFWGVKGIVIIRLKIKDQELWYLTINEESVST